MKKKRIKWDDKPLTKTGRLILEFFLKELSEVTANHVILTWIDDDVPVGQVDFRNLNGELSHILEPEGEPLRALVEKEIKRLIHYHGVTEMALMKHYIDEIQETD